MIARLEEAGADASEVGLGITIDVEQGIKGIADIYGVHLMGLGHRLLSRVVEGAGLFPRPVLRLSERGYGLRSACMYRSRGPT